VQVTTAGELIWTVDGTRIPGFTAPDAVFIGAERVCQCAFEVRFGNRDGQKGAYLTAEYGHHNPGTLIDLEVASGVLVMTQSNVYPPGTYTLSGVVTELTATGQAPIEGAGVARLVRDGWRETTTDGNGFYEIRGLYDGSGVVSVGKAFVAYEKFEQHVTISGDTRFDILLVRR
jgi:hypothetical protein